ncbi:MAG TPA: MFS transporter [Chitinophagaceae bacterium]|nr:MFS transporter [Chitinophagaceae bacterium]
MATNSTLKQLLALPVIVAALGYMVDMYDLFLFNIVRLPSLKALGLSGDELFQKGLFILNTQMAGMLLGGILWGILGDKRGRLSVLFGSIILYSLANIANGFVGTFNQYVALRFIAGIGLAGELGAGITLVAEILPKNIRGYGTTLVATTGLAGAILAYFVADIFSWRTSYFVGGGLGLILLAFRLGVFESGMFLHIKNNITKRGNFLMLFSNRRFFLKYLSAILIGIPIWFVTGVLIFFSPEFGQALGIAEPVNAGKAVMFAFSGQVAGDLVSGFLSQKLQSRKKAMFIFLLGSYCLMLVYLFAGKQTLPTFYIICACLGFFNGYWTLFVTIAAELFGTNIRATVATTVPNFVRASVIPISALFLLGKKLTGIINSGIITGTVVVAIALIALWRLEETFKKELDYTEDKKLNKGQDAAFNKFL